MIFSIHSRLCTVLLSALFCATGAWADVVLVIERDQETLAQYTMEELEAMPPTMISTTNDFIDDEALFSGPLVRDVLEPFGPDLPETVEFFAANDYSVEIAVSELTDFDVIMAISMDGERLSRRDKGPIWIIYPTSEHKELQDAQFNNRLIWQVVRMKLP